jgi:hypothetical protein
MFYKNNWISETVYDDFDDQEDITLVNSIVTVPDDEGNYIVFKCIENNRGGKSINPAEFIALLDNYVWKYMFTVSAYDTAIYQTRDSLPLSYPAYGDVSVITSAKEAVSQIIVESAPFREFSAYLFGAAT